MEEPFPILSHLAELATGGVGSAVVGCNLHSERYAVVHNQPEYGFVTRQSVFEIGSITKVITGILLAAMVERGEVSLSDSVQSVVGISDLPEIWSSISLLDLATHRSGLPRLPPNLEGPFWNPYQGWDS